MIISMPKATSHLKAVKAINVENKIIKRDPVWLETCGKKEEMDFSQITSKSNKNNIDDEIPDLELCD